MGLADDLLILADHLSRPSASDPEQAWLRRSVSTSYYAVFHLLISEAAQLWHGSRAEQIGLERSARHAVMKEVSRAVLSGAWKGWSNPPLPVPPMLKDVSEAFVSLQESRHEADYDKTRAWTGKDARDAVTTAIIAFQDWQAIQGTPVASEFLLSLLIGKKRD